MKKESTYQVIFFVMIFAVWEAVIIIFEIPGYLLPRPSEIILIIPAEFQLLLKHTQVSALEAILGLALGVSAATVLAIATHYFRILEITVYPLVAALQTIPKVAIAPLLLVWLGFGILPKVVISALMCFFPMVINLTKGLKNTDPDLLDVMKVYRISKWEILCRIRVPGAMPDFFAGLKIAVPFSVIGVVVGEFVGAYQGLGYLITQAQAKLDISMVFASIIFLSFIGVFFFTIIELIEKRIVFWRVSENGINEKIVW